MIPAIIRQRERLDELALIVREMAMLGAAVVETPPGHAHIARERAFRFVELATAAAALVPTEQLAEETRPRSVVVVVRDPDASNDATIYGEPDVLVVDVDLGYADLNDQGEWSEWAESELAEAHRLAELGFSEAAAQVREIVWDQRPAPGEIDRDPAGTFTGEIRRRYACPDDGTCHHECDRDECYRVMFAEPLTGVYPGDDWPQVWIDEIRGPGYRLPEQPQESVESGSAERHDDEPDEAGNEHAESGEARNVSEEDPEASPHAEIVARVWVNEETDPLVELTRDDIGDLLDVLVAGKRLLPPMYRVAAGALVDRLTALWPLSDARNWPR